MSESMFGERWASALKPTRKNLKFTKITGSNSRNCVSANAMTFAWSVRKAGSGQPNMCPMDI